MTAHSLPDTRPHRGRIATFGIWTLQLLAAVAFLAAGGFKLAAAPQMVGVFELIGVGQWLRIVTGVIEVAGALMLLVPAVAAFGGLLLAVTMIGATFTHLAVIGGSPLPAVVLLAMTASVAWFRRDRLRAVLLRD